MRIRFTGAIVALAGAAVVTLAVLPIALIFRVPIRKFIRARRRLA